MLQNEYLIAKIGADTAENEPFQVCPLSAYAVCFPFETQSGLLLLLLVAILAQGVAAMSEAAAMG